MMGKIKNTFKLLVALDKLNRLVNQEVDEGIKAAKQKLKEEEEAYQKYGPSVYYDLKNKK